MNATPSEVLDMPVSGEVLDMYAGARPHVIDGLFSEIRSVEGALERVASTRQHLAAQSRKCDAAEEALTARLNALCEAVAKLNAEHASQIKLG